MLINRIHISLFDGHHQFSKFLFAAWAAHSTEQNVIELYMY